MSLSLHSTVWLRTMKTYTFNQALLRSPFSAVVNGSSGCGKSVLIERMLRNQKEVFDTSFTTIIWCYDEWQPLYERLQVDLAVEFVKGIPKDLSEIPPKSLIIIDDLMDEIDKTVSSIFTKKSHHRELSVILITQNLFHQNKYSRDISLNAHYMFIFKNPRDKAQITYLARQLSPTNVKFVQEAYEDATSRPHGYLLVDLKQDTPEELRYRTNILSIDRKHGGIVVYLPGRG